MKPRDVLLASTAAGLALGGLTWLATRLFTDVGPVEPVHIGDRLPEMTGATLAGTVLHLPHDLVGRVAVLMLGDKYDARYEVADWAHAVAAIAGECDDLAYFQVALISGVGPVMRKVIDTAMVRGTEPAERGHVLTVYGDLRELRKRLALSGRPHATVLVLGRTGRIAWRGEGGVSAERRDALAAALQAQGIDVAQV
ncbi:MAG TPA: hypothetical protein VGL77_10875 [Armatimonadota bacterium]|jgi:hypothetical protein